MNWHDSEKSNPGKVASPFPAGTCGFGGRPLTTYTIAVARRSGLFDSVMISIDDDGIAHFAREMVANVPFMRSAKDFRRFRNYG